MTSIIPSTADPETPPSTGAFYDRWTDLFLAGAGPILQAGVIRTGEPPVEEPEQSVLELARRAGIRNGDRILDAGCGVGGPAIAIARRYPHVTIQGVTVSPRQAAIARHLVQLSELDTRVHVLVADYQTLPLPPEQFDKVLFFESTGYVSDLSATLTEAFRVLAPGGRVYVKDVFSRSGRLSEAERTAMRDFDDLWGCVRSKTIAETTDEIQRAGFEVERSGVIEDIGTARLMGAMFQLDPEAGLRRTDLGDSFWRRGLAPPIEFGEILGVKPERSVPTNLLRVRKIATRITPPSPGIPSARSGSIAHGMAPQPGPKGVQANMRPCECLHRFSRPGHPDPAQQPPGMEASLFTCSHRCKARTPGRAAMLVKIGTCCPSIRSGLSHRIHSTCRLQ